MDLHRTPKEPEWANIDPSIRTPLQMIAARTWGIVTPSNIITVVGLAVVLAGLVMIIDGSYWLGLVLIILGRMLDIADGWIAARTHTKSPIGELLDATVDKVGTILTVCVLVVAQVAEWWMILLLISPQVVISVVALQKKKNGGNLHPTRSGKLSMATGWVGIVGLLILKASGGTLVLALVTYLMVIMSFSLGIYALWQYASWKTK